MPHTVITLYHQELIFDNFSASCSENSLHLLRLACLTRSRPNKRGTLPSFHFSCTG